MRNLVRALKYMLALLGLYVAAQAMFRLLRRLYPFPMPAGVAWLLDAPVREWEQTRHTILQHMGLAPGLRVLEVETGAGAFCVEAARAIGPEGKLSVADPSPRMLALAQARVRAAGLDNVEMQVASSASLPFADATFDVAYLVATLGEITDKGRALRELRRVLKPNGRLSITESFSDADYMLMAEVVGWANTVGFELVEEHGNAFLYTLNFRSLFNP